MKAICLFWYFVTFLYSYLRNFPHHSPALRKFHQNYLKLVENAGKSSSNNLSSRYGRMSICGTFSSYSLNLLLFTQVLSVITLTVKYNEYIIDMGKNATIPCTKENSTIWIKENQMEHRQFHAGSDLLLKNVTTQDAGTYTCLISTSSSDASALLNESAEIYQNVDDTYVEAMKIKVIIRTVPGPVSRLSLRISTILGVLMWDFKKNMSGGYPLKSFTAEFRRFAKRNEPLWEWERLDPINIAPNVRYMEVYHLTPNTTYEFRMWGNNYLGAGEIVSTIITTLPEIGDEELIRILLRDVKEFDKNVWTYAVSVVMGAMVILGLTVCFMLLRDCYEEDERAEDEWETLDLIPNIILNPGFFEPDDPDNPSPPYSRTIIFGEDELSSSDDETEEESIPFKRKFSLFFTGDTIKRL